LLFPFQRAYPFTNADRALALLQTFYCVFIYLNCKLYGSKQQKQSKGTWKLYDNSLQMGKKVQEMLTLSKLKAIGTVNV
jgi:hypothetical protein